MLSVLEGVLALSLLQSLDNLLQSELLVLDEQHGQDEVADAHSRQKENPLRATGGGAGMEVRIVVVVGRAGGAGCAASAAVAGDVHHGRFFFVRKGREMNEVDPIAQPRSSLPARPAAALRLLSTLQLSLALLFHC